MTLHWIRRKIPGSKTKQANTSAAAFFRRERCWNERREHSSHSLFDNFGPSLHIKWFGWLAVCNNVILQCQQKLLTDISGMAQQDCQSRSTHRTRRLQASSCNLQSICVFDAVLVLVYVSVGVMVKVYIGLLDVYIGC